MEKTKVVLDFEKPVAILEEQLNKLRETADTHDVDVSKEIASLEATIETTRKNLYQDLSPWQRVQLARHPKRPYSSDYIERIFDAFEELHGDRKFKDDRAIVGGVARLNGEPVMLITQQKGRNTKENMKCNWGSPSPEGYRKALRLMEMADKFGMPIVTIVDTPGAYPGIGSEERHVAEAIAVNIRDMFEFNVPIVTVIIGEGGSGGALGIAVADKVMMLENAYYSVISPEGCAMILWKDRTKTSAAAEALQITADKLLDRGIVDHVIPEPMGGAHHDVDSTARDIKSAIVDALKDLKPQSADALKAGRYEKFRQMGEYNEG